LYDVGVINQESKLAEPPPPHERKIRFDPELLYQAIDRKCRADSLTRREACRQAGDHSPTTIQRLGAGHSLAADSLCRWMHWLGETDLSKFWTSLPR
jgi:hypothetical protein